MFKSCLKTHWISTHWKTVKIEFWEVFAEINFSEENSLIFRKTVNFLGKEFSKGLEATWMEGENSLFPGTENLALSFQKQTQLSLSASGPGRVKIQKYCVDDSPATAESKPTILSQINWEALRSNFLFGNVYSKQRVRSRRRNIMHTFWNMPFSGGVKLIDDTSGPQLFNLWTISLTRSSGNIISVQKGSLCVLQQIFCNTSTPDCI